MGIRMGLNFPHVFGIWMGIIRNLSEAPTYVDFYVEQPPPPPGLGEALLPTATKWKAIRNHGIKTVTTDNAQNVTVAVALDLCPILVVLLTH